MPILFCHYLVKNPEYQAFDAGYPTKNFLKNAHIVDLHVDGVTRGSTYIDPPVGHSGTITIDLKHSFYLLSSFNGGYDLILPNASQAVGRWVTLKKTDLRTHPIRVKEQGGLGPDNRTITLLQRYDTVTLLSNGATWWVCQDSQRRATYSPIRTSVGALLNPLRAWPPSTHPMPS